MLFSACAALQSSDATHVSWPQSTCMKDFQIACAVVAGVKNFNLPLARQAARRGATRLGERLRAELQPRCDHTARGSELCTRAQQACL
eukprot:3097173-Amphidinium_carterae.1